MFHVLGPLRVDAGGAPIVVRPGMPRRVLAALLVHPGMPVSVEMLIDLLWPDRPPSHAVKVVRTYVHRLRKDLGRDQPIRWAADGYRIEVQNSNVDSSLFVKEVVQARKERDAGEYEPARDLLERALLRWQGKPFGGLGTGQMFESEITRLEEWHTAALQDRAELDLLDGRAAEAVPLLSALLAERPHQERAAGQLMRALTQTGRKVEALNVYHRHRQALAAELGLEPGADIRRLHVQILRDQVSTPPDRLTARMAPRQLPADVNGFSGRDEYLRLVDRLTASAGSTPVIAMIVGAAGMGKTTFAVHWAHTVSRRYPDGQLYADLRGFDPRGIPADPAVVVRGFLAALGVSPQRLPPEADAQLALYRSRLAGRRLLVVLDNACDEEQVRPLLPADPACAVVVTSRRRLTGLSTSHGAHIITLDELSTLEATHLMRARLGRPRMGSEPQAAQDIIRRCGGLPLALAIAAANAASRPHVPLAAIATEMRQAPGSLDPFHTNDIATDIRVVFSWSQRHLSAGAATMFRLLGLHPGPEISVAAAAAMSRVPPGQARELLAELAEAHLVTEPAPERYALHDLLRGYAAEQARGVESPQRRQAATRRLFAHYLGRACAADRLLNPDHRLPGGDSDAFADRNAATEWFATERACLLAMLEPVPAERRRAKAWDEQVWRLGLAIAYYLYRHGYWHDQLTTANTALAAAERTGDATAQILAGINTGRAQLQLCRFDTAEDHLRTALKLAEDNGHAWGRAEALLILSWILDLKERRHDAIAYAESALARFRAIRHRRGVARALNTLGWFHTQLGNDRLALRLCREALRIHRELGHRDGQAATLHSLGVAHHHLGAHREALSCHEQALVLFREERTLYFEASTLASLGDAQYALGHEQAAQESWQQALSLLEEIDHPQADSVRTRLGQAESWARLGVHSATVDP